MKGRSLFVRLGAAAAVLIVLGLTLATFGLRAIFNNEIERRANGELTQIVRTVAAQVRIDRDGVPCLMSTFPFRRFETPYSGLYWQVSRADGRGARSRSLWDDHLNTNDVGPVGERRASRSVDRTSRSFWASRRRFWSRRLWARMWRCKSSPLWTGRISPPRSARSCVCWCSARGARFDPDCRDGVLHPPRAAAVRRARARIAGNSRRSEPDVERRFPG